MVRPRIVICLSGGVVQDVYAFDRTTEAIDIEVVLVDWDTDGAEFGAGGLVEIDDGNGRVSRAFVSYTRPQPVSELDGTEVAAAMRKAGMNLADD